jgi:hypothetical protein
MVGIGYERIQLERGIRSGISHYEAELAVDLESDEAVKRAFDVYITTPGPVTPYGRLRAAFKAALEEPR